MSDQPNSSTPYRIIGQINGRSLTDDDANRHWRLLAIVAAAREAFDAEPIIDCLSPDAVYESQDTIEPLTGKKDIAAYLRGRFDFIREAAKTRDTGQFRPGLIDLPIASEHPCLIVIGDGQRQALWVLKLSDQELIDRLDILTLVPSPELAREMDGFSCDRQNI